MSLSIGSVRSLAFLAIPIMLSHLSSGMMLFIDRLFIAQIGTDYINSAMMTNMVYATLTLTFVSLTSIAEVFVGQHNGAKHYNKLSQPVWQMIWLSLVTALLFIPMGLLTGYYILTPAHYSVGSEYYQLIISFGFLVPLIASISGYFIGICSTKIVFFSTIISNILNIFLDYVLIFGHYGFPEYGMTGDAIVTVIALFFQSCILMGTFLFKANHTGNVAFNYQVMKNCIRIGAPTGIAYLLEIGGWTFLMREITAYPMENLIHSLSISVLSLFYLMGDGLFKAISTQAANLIGKHQLNHFNTLLRSSFIIYTVIMFLLYIPLIFMPDPLIGFFIKHTYDSTVFYQAHLALFGVWCYLFIDGIAWIFGSFLRAGGDTVTVLLINVSCSWGLGLVPAMYLIHFHDVHVSFLWMYVFTSYGICNSLFMGLRYFSKKWIKLDLS